MPSTDHHNIDDREAQTKLCIRATNERGIPILIQRPRLLRMRTLSRLYNRLHSTVDRTPTCAPPKRSSSCSFFPLSHPAASVSANMAGLRKAKKYDWKDSNLALFGSDTEKSVSFIYISLIWPFLSFVRFCCAGEESICRDGASLEGSRVQSRNPDMAYREVQG